jgi:hypothetical protein
MAYDSNQRNTLLTAVQADETANASRLAGNVGALMDWCNSPSPSGELRWGRSVPTLTSEDAPVYVGYDVLAQGKRDSWVLFLRNPRDFTVTKVRTWVTDIWGSATAGTNGERVLLAAAAPASNAQVAIGGTVQTAGTVSALILEYQEATSFAEAEWMARQG